MAEEHRRIDPWMIAETLRRFALADVLPIETLKELDAAGVEQVKTMLLGDIERDKASHKALDMLNAYIAANPII